MHHKKYKTIRRFPDGETKTEFWDSLPEAYSEFYEGCQWETWVFNYDTRQYELDGYN